MDCTRNFNTSGYRLVSVERRQNVKYNDPEYRRRIEMLSGIPNQLSNKTDEVDLSRISEADMREFEVRHLLELTDQTMKMDDFEQMAVARGLKIGIVYSILGEYINRAEEQSAAIKQITE